MDGPAVAPSEASGDSLLTAQALCALERLAWMATAANVAMAMPSAMAMLKTGATDNYPYVACALTQFCTVVSLHHSLLMNNLSLVALNCMSLTVWSFCIVSFIYASAKKAEALAVLLAESALLLLLYGYLSMFHAVDSFADALATVSGSMGFLVNCTPGLDLVTSFKCKRVRFDGIALVTGLVNSALLYAYGYAVDDTAIYVPQLPLLTIGAAKMLLVLRYTSKSSG